MLYSKLLDVYKNKDDNIVVAKIQIYPPEDMAGMTEAYFCFTYYPQKEFISLVNYGGYLYHLFKREEYNAKAWYQEKWQIDDEYLLKLFKATVDKFINNNSEEIKYDDKFIIK